MTLYTEKTSLHQVSCDRGSSIYLLCSTHAANSVFGEMEMKGLSTPTTTSLIFKIAMWRLNTHISSAFWPSLGWPSLG